MVATMFKGSRSLRSFNNTEWTVLTVISFTNWFHEKSQSVIKNLESNIIITVYVYVNLLRMQENTGFFWDFLYNLCAKRGRHVHYYLTISNKCIVDNCNTILLDGWMDGQTDRWMDGICLCNLCYNRPFVFRYSCWWLVSPSPIWSCLCCDWFLCCFPMFLQLPPKFKWIEGGGRSLCSGNSVKKHCGHVSCVFEPTFSARAEICNANKYRQAAMKGFIKH